MGWPSIEAGFMRFWRGAKVEKAVKSAFWPCDHASNAKKPGRALGEAVFRAVFA